MAISGARRRRTGTSDRRSASFAPVRIPGPPLLASGLTFAYLLAYPLVIGRADESHLLFGARRVLDGQVIYRDFFEIITPLGFYFFAAVYWLAGTTLLAARVAMALVEAAGAAALFVLVRRVAGTAEAVLATLVFVGLCVPVWPYASAHWMSTTLGLLVATVLLGDRWQRSARARPLVAGLLTGAAICVQQQRGVFLLLWLLLAVPLLAILHPRQGRWRSLIGELAWAMAGAGGVCLTVLGHAAWAASPDLVVDHLYRFAAESYGPRHVGSTTWAGVIPLTEFYLPATWLWLYRVAPLFLVGEALALLLAVRRDRSRPVVVRACLWLLGVLMALSVWYLPDFIHVSFVMPFLLIPGARLLYGLRRWSGWSRVPGGRRLVAIAMVVAALALAGKAVGNVVRARSGLPVRLETGFGTIVGDEFIARLFGAISRHLVAEPAGRSLVYSYPDDAWLYLALPADDATRYSILFESFPQRFVDEALAALRARRPGTVVLMSLSSAPAIEAAVRAGYDLVDEVYPYRIYVRREADAGAAGDAPRP